LLRSPRIWLGVALSALFIVIFLWRTDFGEIGDAFAHANYWWALASIPVYFVAAYFRAWRWKYLMRPLGEFRTSALFPIVIIGFMANNLIPARAGEFVRAYLVGERYSISKMAALGTIAVDRVFDGITLLPFLLIVIRPRRELRPDVFTSRSTCAIAASWRSSSAPAPAGGAGVSEDFSRWLVACAAVCSAPSSRGQTLASRSTPACIPSQPDGHVHGVGDVGHLLAAGATSAAIGSGSASRRLRCLSADRFARTC
jgi:hypothetical protein